MEQVKVLLIDDDEDDFVLTKEVFDQIASNYTVSWVDSYEKGIKAILKKQYDVYLVDYRLGNVSGIDLLNEAINSGCEQPIIILTGKGDFSIDEQAMNIGAADYLVKDDVAAETMDRSIRYAIKQARTLKALKDSESKYRAVFEKAKDPILISDYSGKIHDINDSGLKFFGYEFAELIQLTDHFLFKNADECSKFRELLEKNGFLSDFECEMVSKDGDVYHCSMSSFIQTDMVNVSEVYHTIIRDLSYRKKIEEQSVSLGKMSISEHIAKGLGEEIRNPLSTVNLALDELAADASIADNESVQSYLEIIKSNCDRLNQLMQNFMSSTENKTLNLQRTDIAEVIDEAIAEVKDLLDGYSVELTTDVVPFDKEIFLDRSKIKNVLVSIIKNAVESMQVYPKNIHLSTEIDTGRDAYVISVADNGTGVDPEDQAKIFEPFFTTKKRANGLGLTHAQRVLTTHNGSVSFRPIDKGSLFLISIPIHQEQVNKF